MNIITHIISNYDFFLNDRGYIPAIFASLPITQIIYKKTHWVNVLEK